MVIATPKVYTPGRTAWGTNSFSVKFTGRMCTGTPVCCASTILPSPRYIATWWMVAGLLVS